MAPVLRAGMPDLNQIFMPADSAHCTVCTVTVSWCRGSGGRHAASAAAEAVCLGYGCGLADHWHHAWLAGIIHEGAAL